jgi:hypothetical protein
LNDLALLRTRKVKQGNAIKKCIRKFQNLKEFTFKNGTDGPEGRRNRKFIGNRQNKEAKRYYVLFA